MFVVQNTIRLSKQQKTFSVEINGVAQDISYTSLKDACKATGISYKAACDSVKFFGSITRGTTTIRTVMVQKQSGKGSKTAEI